MDHSSEDIIREDEKVAGDTKHERWPGVMLSLFVPGFGFLRAGQTRRGIEWFVGIYLISLTIDFLKAYDIGHALLLGALMLARFVAFITVLYRSYLPGRMTGRLWVLFTIVFLMLYMTPLPVEFIAPAFRVPTGSMAPTLRGPQGDTPGDRIVVNRFIYWVSKPKRGDLIVFREDFKLDRGLPLWHEHDAYYVKRVVGLPGERIEIRDGSVFADGRRLTIEDGIPPIDYVDMPDRPTTARKEGRVFIVGRNEYFVLGDNPHHSQDSRFWGGLSEKKVYGKVTRIYHPFSRMGEPRYDPEAAEEYRLRAEEVLRLRSEQENDEGAK